jgi:hypothetical protein
MKPVKASAVALLLFCIITISACNPPASDEAGIEAEEITAEEITPLDFPEITEAPIDLPNIVDEYKPERNAFPLVNTRLIYSTCIEGELTFVDKRKEIIELPAGTVSYIPAQPAGEMLGNWRNGTNIFLIFNENGEMAVMRADGKVTTAFDYYSSIEGGDWPGAFYTGKYVLVTRDSGVQNVFGRTGRFGIVNAETGKETVPCIYDRVDMMPSCLYAAQMVGDEIRGVLLDYEGNELYDFGSSPFSANGIDNLYDTHDGNQNSTDNGYYYDRASNAVYHVKKSKDMDIVSPPLPAESSNPEAPPELFYRNHIEPRFVYQTDSNYMAYHDENDSFLIPFGTYRSMYFLGDFIIAGKGYMELDTWDIYDENGNLILADVYGVIREQIWDDGIIIYKDQDTCGILRLDKSFEELPAAPGALSVFLGG